MDIPDFLKTKKFQYFAAFVVIGFILYFAFMPEVNTYVNRLFKGKVSDDNSNLDRDKMIVKGERSAEAMQLQKDIIKAGGELPKYGADGIFGSESVTALKAITGLTETSLNSFSEFVGKEKNALIFSMNQEISGYDGSGISSGVSLTG